MPTKYYRDADGNFLGVYTTESGDHPNLPAGAIESPKPPSGKAKWVDGKWAFTTPYRSARRVRRDTLRTDPEQSEDRL